MTDILIDVTFDKTVPLRHVPGKAIQKEKVKKKGMKTLGVTKPSVAITVPELHWLREYDPINERYFLTLRAVKAAVTFSTSVKIDKEIDKKSDCYKHVRKHELRHVKIWQKGVKAAAPKIKQAIAECIKTAAPEGTEMGKAEVSKFQQSAFVAIKKLLHERVLAEGAAISKKSQSIHTDAEFQETNLVCPAYL